MCSGLTLGSLRDFLQKGKSGRREEGSKVLRRTVAAIDRPAHIRLCILVIVKSLTGRDNLVHDGMVDLFHAFHIFHMVDTGLFLVVQNLLGQNTGI